MNCVLHFLKNENDLQTLESNYDILKPVISDHFVMSFIPNAIPNKQFVQLFYKKPNDLDAHQEEHSRYFFLYQINRFLQSKNYRRVFFVGANTKLKSLHNIPNLIEEVNAFGTDFVKFKYNNEMYEDMFLARISILDNNLDYANCTYELYCNRQRYKNYDVYLSTPFDKVENLEDYI